MRNLDAGSSGTSKGSSGTSKVQAEEQVKMRVDTSDTGFASDTPAQSISGTRSWARSSSYKRERRQKTV